MQADMAFCCFVPTADQLRRSKHLVKSDVRAECYGLRALPPVEKR